MDESRITGLGAREIPGTDGRYEIDIFGNVFRVWKTKPERHLILPVVKRGHYEVKLTLQGGRKVFCVHKLVQRTFLGETPPGKVLYHKNGNRLDNCMNNLDFITRKELGRKTGYRSKRIPVVKKTPSGEEVEFYRSAREAAKANYMSYQTIIDRCNGKVKKPVAPDGYVYCWDK